MKAALPLLFLLLFGVVPQMAAQTTYKLHTPFYCDLASAYPVQYISQFECRGAYFYNGGNAVETFLIQSNHQLWFGGAVNSSPYDSQFVSESLTLPANGHPGHLALVYNFVESNGVEHQARVSATWVDYHRVGRYGWYGPELLSGTLTITP